MKPQWRYRVEHQWSYDVLPWLRYRWGMGRLRWVGLALSQRCSEPNDRPAEWYRRWWLTLKVLVAMALGIRITEAWQHDYLVIATADEHRYYSMECSGAYEWTELIARYHGFGYQIRFEGNC